jgi:hypothetical protein
VKSAIQADKAFDRHGLKSRPVSIPGWLAFECGVSLVLDSENESEARRILAANDIPLKAAYDYD